ncbi:MAG: hypothetical protein L6420_05665 [Elusimicrobia bacterium]|nr:hypothetical protein [Elusimicrobiota bacterium]
MEIDKMKIEIANFVFDFHSEQKRILNILEKRYKNFSVKCRPEFSFKISFFKKPSLPFRPKILFEKKRLILERGDFYCVLDIENKKGVLNISPKVQSFDSFLRVLCSWLLIQNNGFLLHAAAILKNGKGFVFPGKSGAGKSTIAKMIKNKILSPTPYHLPPVVLTDELIPLRIEKGKVKIHGSPFWGEMQSGHKSQVTSHKYMGWGIKLEKIFFLKKSKINSANKISKSEFYKKMLRCVMSFSKQKNDFLKISKTISEIYRKTKVFDLKFSNRDNAFFDII